VLGSRSFLALYKGAVRDALAAQQHACSLAHHGSSMVVRSWVAAVLAEGQSLAGDEAACLAALDEAENLLRDAPHDDPAVDVFDRPGSPAIGVPASCASTGPMTPSLS
jgi:hypothetical protein